MKKILSLVLVIVSFAVVSPVAAEENVDFAQYQYTASSEDVEVTSFTFNDDDSTSTGDFLGVTLIESETNTENQEPVSTTSSDKEISVVADLSSSDDQTGGTTSFSVSGCTREKVRLTKEQVVIVITCGGFSASTN